MVFLLWFGDDVEVWVVAEFFDDNVCVFRGWNNEVFTADEVEKWDVGLFDFGDRVYGVQLVICRLGIGFETITLFALAPVIG